MDLSTPPGSVLSYAGRLIGRLMTVSGGALQAAYLHGSAALGGWVPGRSDVDMLFVAADDISGAAVTRIGEVLGEGAGDCPGRELECSVVTVTQARQPAPPWPFVLHVTAGPGTPGRTVRPDGRSPGDPDLLMHYAVCRAAGWPVCGPPPQDLIGTVPRRTILDHLAGELGWGIGHAPEAYAVLNACRAQVYLTDHKIVSKIAGGEAVLSRGTGPAEVIKRALAQQRGSEPDQPAAADAVSFVLATAAALRSAADGSLLLAAALLDPDVAGDRVPGHDDGRRARIRRLGGLVADVRGVGA
jgi:streptomycin 3"-adenylyltransferase